MDFHGTTLSESGLANVTFIVFFTYEKEIKITYA